MTAADNIALTVFPFEDLSLTKELNIFCRSFSAELVIELSKFKQFQVMNAAKSFDDGSKIPDDLHSDYFIQGSFRHDKDPLRVNVQLYNSRTRHLVWGNRLEAKLTDLHELQEKLLTEIVGVLQQQINYDLLSKIKRKQKVEFSAYEHWLHGIEELKKGSIENDGRAREYFQKALDVQPDYSLAYSGMSLTYFNEWSCQLWDRWDVCKTGAYEWAQKAIELDDQNYIAAMVLGKIFIYDGSYETAEYYLRRSLALNQNDPDTLILIAAYFVYLGLGREALALYERTLRLNPLGSSAYMPIGAFILFELSEFEKAASLIVPSSFSHWADSEAYYAAVYYYLRQYDKMQLYWNKFLATYRRLISHGKDFSIEEACEWLMKINPHRHKDNLEIFLEFISDGSFKKIPSRQAANKIHAPDYHFIKDAAGWTVSYEGSETQLPEVKGFYDIQKLLSQPRQLFHCAELMGSAVNEKGENVFDTKAKRDYEKKIVILQKDIQEAEEHSDFARLEKLQDEYDQLIDHLSQSLGLNRKTRQTGSTVERARSAVTWRIRSAIGKIESHHPQLGAHLSNAIKTGTFCSYQPERNLNWITG